MTKQTLKLDDKLVDNLRWIAKSHGYTIGRGPHADEGSIRQLVEAIAVGDLDIFNPNIPSMNMTDEEIEQAIKSVG